MLLEKALLEKSDLQKFNMYRHLKSWESRTFTINDLSRATGLSYQQTYNSFQDLLVDLRQMTPTLKNTKHNALLEVRTFTVSVDQYRLFLVENSLAFMFVDYLLHCPEPTLVAFCEEHFVSRSTFFRKINGLKNLLARYGLKFSYANLSIKGNEANIRLVLFYIYWLVFHGLKWPFKTVDHAAVKQQQEQLSKGVQLNELQILQEQYLLGMCATRIKNGNLLPDQAEHLFPVPVVPYPAPDSLNLTDEQVTNEYGFYQFYQYTHCTFTDTPETQYFYHYCQEERNLAWQFVQELLGFFNQCCSAQLIHKMSADHVLITNLLRLATRIQYSQQMTPVAADFVEQVIKPAQHHTLAQQLTNFFDSIAANQQMAIFMRERLGMREALLQILMPYASELEKQGTLHIQLLIEDGLTNYLLEDYLTALPITTIMTPQQKGITPDLIITTLDNSLLPPSAAPIFSWPLCADDNSYYVLWHHLKKIYQQKTM